MSLYRRIGMEQPDPRIDRLLTEISQLRQRVNSIPTTAELCWMLVAGSIAIGLYSYLAK